jgi:hypothetical protein
MKPLASFARHTVRDHLAELTKRAPAMAVVATDTLATVRLTLLVHETTQRKTNDIVTATIVFSIGVNLNGATHAVAFL